MSDVIRILKGPDRVRLRPAVIFGDDGIEGAQCAVEMLLRIMASECVDGHSSRLDVTLYPDQSLEITNYGRGIYFGEPDEDNDTLWKELFCEIYAGSKFADTCEEAVPAIFESPEAVSSRVYRIEGYDQMYLCAVQYASEYMDVCSVRDGYQYTLHFEKGENLGGLKKTPCSLVSETKIRFKLDQEVFSEIGITRNFLSTELETLALLNPGVICSLGEAGEASRQVFSFPNGIADYFQNYRGTDDHLPVYLNCIEGKGQERYNRPFYQAKVQIGVSFEKNRGYIQCYHNQRELTVGGTHLREALSSIGKYLSDRLGIPLSHEQLREHLQLVIHSQSSTVPLWENGTRSGICNTVIKDMTHDALGEPFAYFLRKNQNKILGIFSE
jgi:DNA gyrase subunit B